MHVGMLPTLLILFIVLISLPHPALCATPETSWRAVVDAAAAPCTIPRRHALTASEFSVAFRGRRPVIFPRASSDSATLRRLMARDALLERWWAFCLLAKRQPTPNLHGSLLAPFHLVRGDETVTLAHAVSASIAKRFDVPLRAALEETVDHVVEPGEAATDLWYLFGDNSVPDSSWDALVRSSQYSDPLGSECFMILNPDQALRAASIVCCRQRSRGLGSGWAS